MSAVLPHLEITPQRPHWLAGAPGFEPGNGGIAIRQSAEVHFLSDGRFYGGTSDHLPGAKLWPLPHIPAIVAVRGHQLLSPVVASVLNRVGRTYDELKGSAVQALQPYLHDVFAMMPAPPDDALDIIIGG